MAGREPDPLGNCRSSRFSQQLTRSDRSASHWVTSGQNTLWALELTERPMWPASRVRHLTSFDPTLDLRDSLWLGGTRWSALAMRICNGQVILLRSTSSSPSLNSPLISSLRWYSFLTNSRKVSPETGILSPVHFSMAK